MNCLGNLAKEKQKNCKMCEVFDKKKTGRNNRRECRRRKTNCEPPR